MKKIIGLFVIAVVSLGLIACKEEVMEEKDLIAPLLNVNPMVVEIDFLEEYDLMTGVSALDNIDEVITDKVTIDDDGFDNSIPGEYEITYQVIDSSGNKAIKKRFIIVKGLPTYLEGYSNSELYLLEIEGEKPKPETHNCFPGDWSRKAESSFDYWLGMEAVIVLPTFEPDKDRYDGSKYLDNASIYFGGNAGYESDVGLLWEIGMLPNGELSKEKIAFRPFWRYIHNGDNIWANANDYEPNNFYYPGDILRISVFSPKANYLQLKIEVIKPTDEDKYVLLREEYGVIYPHDFLSPEFPSNGHGVTLARFMRVNAIDQYYNEGQTSKPTNAVVNEMIWKEVYLYRKIAGIIYKVPFTSDRYIEANCPLKAAFTITYDGVDKSLGGEKVIIHPGEAN